jgi:transposase
LTPSELGLQDCKEQAIRTAFKLVGYGRRVAKRKGFSDDPAVIAERLAFAKQGIQWTRERLMQQIFSDEVWASGGAHTQSYVTVKEDGSDRYDKDCLQHKYSKLPAWMFHGSIVAGKKGPAVFWEKAWGSMDSAKYDAVILNNIEAFLDANGPFERTRRGYIWMQDNASCHRSKTTKINLRLRNIPTIQWPRYSPDLNLIEHVWNWMKNYIQQRYYAVYYDASKVSLEELRRIIWEAWDAVPDSYIQTLFNSWWRRCQAVIDARGGPTRY